MQELCITVVIRQQDVYVTKTFALKRAHSLKLLDAEDPAHTILCCCTTDTNDQMTYRTSAWKALFFYFFVYSLLESFPLYL